MRLYISRIVDDFDAGIASSLVCHPADSIFSILSQPGLADIQLHRYVVLSKVCVSAEYHANLGAAGRISAPVCTSGSRINL